MGKIICPICGNVLGEEGEKYVIILTFLPGEREAIFCENCGIWLKVKKK